MNVFQKTYGLETQIDQITPMLLGWGWDAHPTQTRDVMYENSIDAMAKVLQKNVYTKLSLAQVYSMFGIEIEGGYTQSPEVFSNLMAWAVQHGVGRITYWGAYYSDNSFPNGTYSTTINPIPQALLKGAGITPYTTSGH